LELGLDPVGVCSSTLLPKAAMGIHSIAINKINVITSLVFMLFSPLFSLGYMSREG